MLAAHWPREEQLTLVSGAVAWPTLLTLCTVMEGIFATPDTPAAALTC